jgi:hypothetical protein
VVTLAEIVGEDDVPDASHATEPPTKHGGFKKGRRVPCPACTQVLKRLTVRVPA